MVEIGEIKTNRKIRVYRKVGNKWISKTLPKGTNVRIVASMRNKKGKRKYHIEHKGYGAIINERSLK